MCVFLRWILCNEADCLAGGLFCFECILSRHFHAKNRYSRIISISILGQLSNLYFSHTFLCHKFLRLGQCRRIESEKEFYA